MKFEHATTELSAKKADIWVVGVFQDENVLQVMRTITNTLFKIKDEFLVHLEETIKEELFKGKNGQILVLPSYLWLNCKKLVLLGLGPRKKFDSTYNRKAAAALARCLSRNKAKTVAYFPGLEIGSDKKITSVKRKLIDESMQAQNLAAEQSIASFVEGFLLANYSFIKYKSTAEEKNKTCPELFLFVTSDITSGAFKRALKFAEAIANATMLARDLVAEPASYMTPTRLADQSKQIAKKVDISCTVMDIAQIAKLKMGSFMGVAQGAKEPAKFIVMRYKCAKTAKKKIAIVGKGITFDSGGLSLKSAQGMEHMKYDMSGAATVIATMQVVGLLQPNVDVIGIVAATENMPSGTALHPGDILKAMNGKTIEVNNTDAEGRLILADALTYAEQQEVDEIIDLATLTGAIVTALGRVAAGIMGSDQPLINRLIEAGDKAGEKLWQLPLYDEYKEALKSDIADLKNAGSRGEAGSACAAMFLKEFIGNKPWAHIDIAGPAWLEKERDECNKGGTGFGVRTLCYYLLDL